MKNNKVTSIEDILGRLAKDIKYMITVNCDYTYIFDMTQIKIDDNGNLNPKIIYTADPDPQYISITFTDNWLFDEVRNNFNDIIIHGGIINTTVYTAEGLLERCNLYKLKFRFDKSHVNIDGTYDVKCSKLLMSNLKNDYKEFCISVKDGKVVYIDKETLDKISHCLLSLDEAI